MEKAPKAATIQPTNEPGAVDRLPGVDCEKSIVLQWLVQKCPANICVVRMLILRYPPGSAARNRPPGAQGYCPQYADDTVVNEDQPGRGCAQGRDGPTPMAAGGECRPYYDKNPCRGGWGAGRRAGRSSQAIAPALGFC